MKKNFLTIFANSQHSNFGFGDYLRILSFVPNLKYKKIVWISDKKLFPIAKNSDHLNKICDIKNKNNFVYVKKTNTEWYEIDNQKDYKIARKYVEK